MCTATFLSTQEIFNGAEDASLILYPRRTGRKESGRVLGYPGWGLAATDSPCRSASSWLCDLGCLSTARALASSPIQWKYSYLSGLLRELKKQHTQEACLWCLCIEGTQNLATKRLNSGSEWSSNTPTYMWQSWNYNSEWTPKQ